MKPIELIQSHRHSRMDSVQPHPSLVDPFGGAKPKMKRKNGLIKWLLDITQKKDPEIHHDRKTNEQKTKGRSKIRNEPGGAWWASTLHARDPPSRQLRPPSCTNFR